MQPRACRRLVKRFDLLVQLVDKNSDTPALLITLSCLFAISIPVAFFNNPSICASKLFQFHGFFFYSSSYMKYIFDWNKNRNIHPSVLWTPVKTSSHLKDVNECISYVNENKFMIVMKYSIIWQLKCTTLDFEDEHFLSHEDKHTYQYLNQNQTEVRRKTQRNIIYHNPKIEGGCSFKRSVHWFWISTVSFFYENQG